MSPHQIRPGPRYPITLPCKQRPLVLDKARPWTDACTTPGADWRSAPDLL